MGITAVCGLVGRRYRGQCRWSPADRLGGLPVVVQASHTETTNRGMIREIPNEYWRSQWRSTRDATSVSRQVRSPRTRYGTREALTGALHAIGCYVGFQTGRAFNNARGAPWQRVCVRVGNKLACLDLMRHRDYSVFLLCPQTKCPNPCLQSAPV